jgi:hypothetical protein
MLRHACGFKLANDGVVTLKASADHFVANMLPIIRSLQRGGISNNAIAGQLNERNVKTARGGKWTHVQVGNILARGGADPAKKSRRRSEAVRIFRSIIRGVSLST